MSAHTRDYDFTLPEELIARYPLPRREDARMMVLDPRAGTIEHGNFRDFPNYVGATDLVVLNDTKVIPARIFSDDGRIEFLFLEPVGECTWKCLVKPGRKMRSGASAVLQGQRGIVTDVLPDGERIVFLDGPIDLEKGGTLPLPPYMERQADVGDLERYQTVFAKEKGAVAAPTAGLHFTPEILAKVPHAFLTLHVGVGTFRPVQVEDLSEHRMHSERFRLPGEVAASINAAENVLAVGTTTTRVLETCGRSGAPLVETDGSTDIFIHPPYEFAIVDRLLTNFHLPKSTLLMLVSAFAGREFILQAYEEAVRERYRFYSYGDCMLIR